MPGRQHPALRMKPLVGNMSIKKTDVHLELEIAFA